MIESFADRRLKRSFEAGDRSEIAPEMARRIDQILTALELAIAIEDLSLPSFRLHQLKGELKGFYAASAIELID